MLSLHGQVRIERVGLEHHGDAALGRRHDVDILRRRSARAPEVESSSPAMMRSSVDLPQPDGPTKTTNSPSFTSRSMPFSTSTVPKDFLHMLDGQRAHAASSQCRQSLEFITAAPPCPLHALVGGEADARASCTASSMWRVRSMSSRIAFSTIGLLAVAERLVVGLVGHREHPGRACANLPSAPSRGAVDADACRSWCGCRCRRTWRPRP